MQTAEGSSWKSEVGINSFIYRLFSLLLTGVALILAAYSAYLTFYRLPAFKTLFKDFGTELPGLTLWYLQNAWVPLVASAVSLLAAVLSLIKMSRLLISAACICLIACAALIAFAQVATDLPMIRLTESISGGF